MTIKNGIIHVQMYVGNVFNQGGHMVAGTKYYIVTIVSVFLYMTLTAEYIYENMLLPTLF